MVSASRVVQRSLLGDKERVCFVLAEDRSSAECLTRKGMFRSQEVFNLPADV